MNLRTYLLAVSQIDDNELMTMISSALKSGVQTMLEFANAHGVTVTSLVHWVKQNGRPGWRQLRKMHGPTAPKKPKKRKGGVKKGEKHTKKKK
jgi:hypothetical protein